MKKILMAVALATMSMASACTTLPDTAVAQSTLLDEKALYTAEAAYNSVATAYLKLSDGSQLKARTKPLMIKAGDGLLVLRAAHRTGDSRTFNGQLVAFNDTINQLKALLP